MKILNTKKKPEPLAVIRWQSDLMEIIQGIQMEINATCHKIQLNHQIMATPYLRR